jgi:hypothetical protein
MDSRRRIVALTPSAALYHAAEREKLFWRFAGKATTIVPHRQPKAIGAKS